MDTSSSTPVAAVVPKKEEEYDSSATMSADERESEPRTTSCYPNMAQQQPQMGQPPYGLPQGLGRDASIRPLYPGNAMASIQRPAMAAPPPAGTIIRPGLNVRPMGAPTMVPNAANPQTVVLADGAPKDTITVKELMINVIEKSLQGPGQPNPQAPPGIPHIPPNQPPPSPTIQTILDNSSKPTNKPNYVRDRIGLNPRTVGGAPPGAMAPPAVPPPSQQQQQAAAQAAAAAAAASQSSNDCETLDLSMPRRRESAATPPSFSRDPLPHRKSPSFASMSSPADVRPPPAHANKVKTEPYLREISPSSYDGRPLATPPHGIGGTSPSPGPPRPPSSSSRVLPQTTQAYIGRNPMSQPTVTGRQPALSPKVTSKPPLTIQTGSITQGTPVQQGAQQRYGEPLLKMTPSDVRASGGGSITQGTPVYDKTARRIQESALAYARHGVGGSAATAASVLAAAGYPGPEQHLTSRQVIMNDFAMARSNEMQRRPDSRDAHGRSVSPASASRAGALRDLSPRPRSLDHRTAAQLTGGRPTSSDPRLDPRYIQAVAEQQHRSIAGLPEPRGDPKADLPSVHKDPRGLQRAQPASTLSRSYFVGPNSTVSNAPPSQQVCTTKFLNF